MSGFFFKYQETAEGQVNMFRIFYGKSMFICVMEQFACNNAL